MSPAVARAVKATQRMVAAFDALAARRKPRRAAPKTKRPRRARRSLVGPKARAAAAGGLADLVLDVGGFLDQPHVEVSAPAAKKLAGLRWPAAVFGARRDALAPPVPVMKAFEVRCIADGRVLAHGPSVDEAVDRAASLFGSPR